MKNLEILSESEKQLLLKFPAYISLLAANHDGHADEAERKCAIWFSHIKTYTCHPRLFEFYHEADKVFEKNFTELDNTLPQTKDERGKAIKNELLKLETILLKLGSEYVAIMHFSMNSFKTHVSQAHRNILEYFIFPLPMKGFND